jgi:hypothetical protein
MLEHGRVDMEGKAGVRHVEDDEKTAVGDAHVRSDSDTTNPPA